MRIFKTRVFHRFTRKSGIDDAMLRDAIDNAEQGLIDADLGGGVIKQRIARPGRGKSGGFRPSSCFGKRNELSSSTDLPRTSATISGTTNWQRSELSRRPF
jgi:hypothetical protein